MKASEILKQHKLRVTDNRIKLIELLSAQEVALSAQDIEERLPGSDRVTLYRSLKSFQEKGIIHKAVDGTDTPKFAMCVSNCTEHNHQDNHIHFHCDSCGNTYCLEEMEVPSFTVPEGFVTQSTNVVVSGMCSKC